MTELAKRAVACKHWRWMPGMRLIHPTYGATRVAVVGVDRGVWVVKEKARALEYLHTRFNEIEGCLPDLTDPATVGCLITLVQEAHPECRVDLCVDLARVIRSGGEAGNITDGWLPTAEALVAALEAAP